MVAGIVIYLWGAETLVWFALWMDALECVLFGGTVENFLYKFRHDTGVF
jgi:hypothetical protein